MNVDALRQQLMDDGLAAELAQCDPFDLCSEWLSTARDAGIFNAHSMALATATSGGAPSVRNVLMQGIVDGGFTFYTNRESEKGQVLADNPVAEGLFSWLPLERQIRVRGAVIELDDAASDAYFASRPRESQLAAVASDQSREIPDREYLVKRFHVLETANDGRSVERPAHWGGYAIVADRVEFWQGARHRLHDRLVFTRSDDGWATSRLAP